jgi:hypothetical protein
MTGFSKLAAAFRLFGAARWRDDDNSSRWLVQIAAVLAYLMLSGYAFAARPLPRFEVWVDGKPALKTFGGRRGDTADRLWLCLKKVGFEQVTAGVRRLPPYRVEADSNDPLRATLKGKIVVTVEEGGRAEVSELSLIREDDNARWMIAPEDVERTLKSRHKPFLIVVSLDGTPELSTGIVTRTGNTPDNPENVWQCLKRLGLIPIRGQLLQTDTDDSLRATLTGSVVVELKYDNRPWGRAEVSTLKLVRQNAKTRSWQVDPADVDRTLSKRNGNQGAAGGDAPDNASRPEASNSAAGTWKWSVGRTQMRLRLKQDGNVLTGVLIANSGPETVIEDGTYNDGRISFKVSRQDGKAKITAEYAGTVSGDSIKGGLRAFVGPRPKTMPARPMPWQANRAEN